MFQINRRLIVFQTLIISPPLELGDVLFFQRRPTVSLSVCNSVANLQKKTIYNPNVYLVNDNIYIQILVSISLFVLKTLRIN